MSASLSATNVTSTTAIHALRTVSKIFRANSQKEGAGFVVQRPFPSRQISDEESDPFLMLDEFGPRDLPPNGPGAPWHPHRGFDTVTYMRHGESAHQDSMGNSGTVRSGEVQWMRAASGVIHDEGRNHPGGLIHGFQLWVNLPAQLKMAAPQYQQLSSNTFQWKELKTQGSKLARIKVIAGTVSDVGAEESLEASPLELSVPLLVADVQVEGGGCCVLPIPNNFETCIIYVYHGSARVFNGERDAAGTPIGRQDTVVFGKSGGGGIRITGDDSTTPFFREETGEKAAVSFLIMAGQRIGEPIARHGPFVMNSRAELEQAFEDYQKGELVKFKASAKTF